MKRTIISFLSLGAVVAIIFSCGRAGHSTEPVNAISKDSLIKKGEYLVTIMGCNDCHTPTIMTETGPMPDPNRILSGHNAQSPIAKFDTATAKRWALFDHSGTAIVGPWGISFSGNLTSDETGIGNWSEEQFKKALTEGKFKGLDGGRMLLPPMPWPNYRNMKEEDIKAIFAYLKSTRPVSNVVPGPVSPAELKKYVL